MKIFRIHKNLPALLMMLILVSSASAQEVTDSLDKTTGYDSTSAQTDSEEDTVDEIAALPDSFVLRHVPESLVDSLRQNPVFAYANDPAYYTREKKRDENTWAENIFRFLSSSLFRIIFFSLMGFLVLFAIFRLADGSNLLVFGRKNTRMKKSLETAFTEIDEENFESLIRDAEKKEDFRSAVRFHFLQSLRLMNDRGWIRYHAQATNFEYLRQLASYPVAREFGFLMRIYEYAWYGGFPVTRIQYELVSRRFRDLNNTIGA